MMKVAVKVSAFGTVLSSKRPALESHATPGWPNPFCARR